VIGYENHAGRTFLGPECIPFGRVIDRHGFGNNDDDCTDGVRYRNVIGTYLHGPLLSKNPEVADYLIDTALKRQAEREGAPAPMLPCIDDAAETAANTFICKRLGIK
ncbi:MAG: glutamine amidotransferase, partial [Coriobacteriaceae bacterium]|nr:glutamine amidotransferase [Coriobacteriaceae bacterium]